MTQRPYRGRRIDNGEWVEGWLVVGTENKAYYIFTTDEIAQWLVDPSTVGQYTGIKNFYEGDISPPAQRTRGEVTIICYDSQQAQYKAVPLSLFHANAGNGGWTGFSLSSFSEVIGNRWDNPELLEGTKP
ncbi:YopX family protein [Paenibacillus sp. CAU 1782]